MQCPLLLFASQVLEHLGYICNFAYPLTSARVSQLLLQGRRRSTPHSQDLTYFPRLAMPTRQGRMILRRSGRRKLTRSVILSPHSKPQQKQSNKHKFQIAGCIHLCITDVWRLDNSGCEVPRGTALTHQASWSLLAWLHLQWFLPSLKIRSCSSLRLYTWWMPLLGLKIGHGARLAML